ncbi:MAG: aspartate-semialdehyde dehydrogenase [Anaerolineales bacterium]
MKTKIPVVVLGATGAVGQRFISLLNNHPWFEVAALTGSERSIGKPYHQTCNWILPEPMPDWAARCIVQASDPQALSRFPLVFSALHSEQARPLEPEFAQRGVFVCSNASAYRNEPDVPILMPEVNPQHLDLLRLQQARRGWQGGIVTNSNCTSAGITVVFQALQQAFGLQRVFAVSMQALSGAGYPGVASLDALDNVIPYISGEDEKVEWEPRKMLATLTPTGELLPADFSISAQTHRVPVSDGHTVSMAVELGRAASPQEAEAVLSAYLPPEVARGLPSTPSPVIVVRHEVNRPQPRLDRWTGKGMTTVVGRLRPDPLLHLKMTVLSHNTVRGAAGGAIYNAELLVKCGWVG